MLLADCKAASSEEYVDVTEACRSSSTTLADRAMKVVPTDLQGHNLGSSWLPMQDRDLGQGRLGLTMTLVNFFISASIYPAPHFSSLFLLPESKHCENQFSVTFPPSIIVTLLRQIVPRLGLSCSFHLFCTLFPLSLSIVNNIQQVFVFPPLDHRSSQATKHTSV